MATLSPMTVLIVILSVLKHTILYLSARVCVTWIVGLRVFKFNGQKCLTLFISAQCIQQIFIDSIFYVLLEHILAPHNNVIK